MKCVRLFAAFLALGLLGACRQSDMRTLIVRVPQVTNAACESRVRQALQPLKGIESLEFDHAAGTLTLRYESMILAHKNIEHAIIAAGFEAATVERVLRLVRIGEWKRHQAAPGPKVSLRAFGRERRYPISNGYRD